MNKSVKNSESSSSESQKLSKISNIKHNTEHEVTSIRSRTRSYSLSPRRKKLPIQKKYRSIGYKGGSIRRDLIEWIDPNPKLNFRGMKLSSRSQKNNEYRQYHKKPELLNIFRFQSSMGYRRNLQIIKKQKNFRISLLKDNPYGSAILDRAGIILYTYTQKLYSNPVWEYNFIMAKDAQSGELSDFGGGRNQNDNNSTMTAIRELKEETLGVLINCENLEEKDLQNCLSMSSDQMLLIFVPVEGHFKDFRKNFLRKSHMTENVEVIDIVNIPQHLFLRKLFPDSFPNRLGSTNRLPDIYDLVKIFIRRCVEETKKNFLDFL